MIVDDEAEPKPEQRLELVFFLRTWALSHPDLAFEIQDTMLSENRFQALEK